MYRARKHLVFYLLIAIIVFGLSSAAAQSPQKVVIKAARMLNVKNGEIIKNPVIVIEGERIAQIDAGVVLPKDAEVIDLGDVTVMPGLIDAHTHLLQNYDSKFGGDDPNMILTVTQLGTTRRALLGAAMGREMLEAGFTTVRDLGNSGLNGDVALRDAIRNGWVQGPRIIASTRALSAAGGQFGNLTAETQKLIEQEYIVVNGVEDARRAVREAFYNGADCIKVIVNTGSRILSLEEMKTIVEEAHRVGKKVAAHAIGDLATRTAVEAGVDSIEHAYVIPDNVLQMMAQKKIFLVPTDYPAEFYLGLYNLNSDTPPEQAKQITEGVEGQVKSNQDRLSRAIKAGVRIAAGSDEYYMVKGKNRGQASLQMFRAYLASGLTPLEIIRAATINNAELLAGERAPFGTLEKGKYADLIAVPNDPLKDITVLEKATFVMKGGKIVKRTDR